MARTFTLLLSSYLLMSCSQLDKEPLFSALSAHRGRTAIALERGVEDNSPEAILIASRHAEFIELDVRQTKDGKLIVGHDKRGDLRRTVAEMTFRDLQRVKAKPPLLLDEVISLLPLHTSVYTLDVKGYSPRLFLTLLPLLQRHKARLLIQCSSLTCLREVRAKDLLLPVLTRLHSAEQFDDALILKPNMVQIDEEWSGEYYVRIAHLFNIPVLIKTLFPNEDNKERWHRLWKQGVDVILTDYPDRAREEQLSASR